MVAGASEVRLPDCGGNPAAVALGDCLRMAVDVCPSGKPGREFLAGHAGRKELPILVGCNRCHCNGMLPVPLLRDGIRWRETRKGGGYVQGNSVLDVLLLEQEQAYTERRDGCLQCHVDDGGHVASQPDDARDLVRIVRMGCVGKPLLCLDGQGRVEQTESGCLPVGFGFAYPLSLDKQAGVLPTSEVGGDESEIRGDG